MQKFILIVILIAMPVSVFSQEQENEISQINEIAESLAELTGMAINPLLVTTAIGIYKNIQASSKGERDQLPWYYQPWFLIICGILVAMAFIISVPSAVNFPPQVSEFVELVNKKIGFVLVTPVLYDIVTPISSLLANNTYASLTAGDIYMHASFIPLELLAGLPQILWMGITLAMMFFVFAAIWLLNYVFDFLVFLCPFGWAETVLKSARAIYFGLLLGLSAIHPLLGLILTLPTIVIAVLVFGWSVRRAVMGFVFLRDFIVRKKEMVIDDKGILVFSGPSLKMPTKRMGRLNEKDGKWTFSYKKAFIFKKTRTIDKTESFLRKGFLSSHVLDDRKLLCSLPPRYQKIPEQVQTYLRIDKLEDTPLKKGIKAFIAWAKNLFHRNDLLPQKAGIILAAFFLCNCT